MDDRERLLAVTLACRSARLIAVRYQAFMQVLGARFMDSKELESELEQVNHVLHMIDTATKEKE